MLRRRGWPLALAAVALLASCTTTAEKTHLVVTPGSSVVLSSGGGPAGAGHGPSAAAGGAAAAQGGGAGGASAGGGGGAAAQAGGGGGGAQGSGSGSTGPIKMGFWVVDASAGCKALGAKASCANDAPYITAGVNYLNAHGGIAGRKIQSFIFVSDALTGSWAVQSATACAQLIEDDHSQFVMAPWVGGRDFFAACAAEHGVPVVDTGYWPYDTVEEESLAPYLYIPSRPSPDRWVAAYVNGLYNEGYFDPGAKIGLVRFDAAPFTRVTDSVLIPALQSHGLTLTDDIAVATPQSTTDLGPMSSQLGNAILKLRSDGVDHVLVFDLGSELTFFLLPQAESQGYRPRWGFSSYQDMDLLLQNVPLDQFEHSLGVGWSPVLDVEPQDDTGSPMATLCKNIYAAAGLVPGTGRSLYCDTLYFYKDALEAGGSISVAGLRAGASALGQTFQASMTLGTTFDSTRYDGASVARGFAYVDSCQCFRYQGAPFSM